MADYDLAFDAIGDIEQFISGKILKLRAIVVPKYQTPGDIQAAYLLANIVCPSKSCAFICSSVLYDLAVDLADSVEQLLAAGERADGPPVWPYITSDADGGFMGSDLSGRTVREFVAQIHAWVAIVDALRQPETMSDGTRRQGTVQALVL